MTIRVDKKMREKIDIKKINVKENRYIYSADGKNVFRTLIDDKYCDVSGVELDKPKENNYINRFTVYKKLELIEEKLDELIKRYDSN